jgi:hypothetical protein
VGVTFKDRLAALKDALGPRRYMLVPLIGAGAGVADLLAVRYASFSVSGYFGSFAIGLLAAVLAAAWMLLERLAQVERRMKGARVDLSKLRSEGVRIRNDGMNVATTTWEEWRTVTESWNTRTIECIGKIDQGCAEWFSVLDIVPAPRIEGVRLNGHQVNVYAQHDCRVARLGDLIQQLWER